MSEQIPTRDPNKVDIYDTTGRDGLQTVGVSMSQENRVRMSLQLESIGVDIIEAGFPASGEATTDHELEVVQAVAVALNGAKVAALCRLEPADIENGWAGVEPGKDNSGGVRLHTFISTSDIQMNEQKLTPEKVKELTASEVARAKSFCNDVEFSPMDASRSDFELVKEVCRIAVENGATVLNIPDTTGFMTYREYGRMIAAIREDIQPGYPYVVFSAHTHGDRDLGTPAAMEAIGIGSVRQVEVAVNKLGPRLGNGDLASVVGNIREGGDPIPPGTYTNVDPSRLVETSNMVAGFSGKAALAELPFTSPAAFAHAEGIHQHDIVGNPRSFESMEATAYGQEAGQIVLGPLSGRAGVRKRLENIGIELETDDLNAVTARVKELATEESRNLEDNDIERLAAEVTGETIVDHYQLDSVDAGEKHGVAHAKVKVTNLDGKNVKKSVRLPGEGAIDAMVTAMNQATDFEGGVANWKGASLWPGEDAVGGITVIVKQNGYSVRVYDADSSVLQASAKAYMIGRNMIKRREAEDRHKEWLENGGFRGWNSLPPL
jgi:2-isopropylmalate synthase